MSKNNTLFGSSKARKFIRPSSQQFLNYINQAWCKNIICFQKQNKTGVKNIHAALPK
jgi:hypothetical protein